MHPPDPDQSTCDELMTSFSQPQRGSVAAVPASELMRRHPVRISAAIPWGLHQRLQDQAAIDGRSLSNLIAHLLELASME